MCSVAGMQEIYMLALCAQSTVLAYSVFVKSDSSCLHHLFSGSNGFFGCSCLPAMFVPAH